MTNRFAFYGRVSTEDQQDPTSSKQWQRSRAESILPDDGVIVAEFFDIGQSRSLPWKRRPESTRLLEAMKCRDRGFEAVVIGEPSRAFSGAQFQNTYPLFTHYGVQLWVPDVGGYVDPASDGAEMMMAIYGTMSAQERRRIKIRVRGAMTEQARIEGRFLGGRPPYGYALADNGPHINPGKAAAGQRMHRLEIDPTAAPIVQRIFADYLGGAGIYAIAEGLTRDDIPSPSAHDPARNRHRDTRAWSKYAVRAILKNPKYTGKMVWNRQRRDEELFDEDDVAAGFQSRMKWNDRTDWVWSSEEMHKPIISSKDFAAAQGQMAAHAHRPTNRKVRAQRREYVLSGLVRCSACGRRMQGSWNHDSAYYRCRFPAEYALANKVDHPKNVYVAEQLIVPRLNEWVSSLFAPENFEATLASMLAAPAEDDAMVARAEAAKRKLADCDQRLAKYRQLLDRGEADVALVSTWMSEVTGERLAAEADLAVSTATAPPSEERLRADLALLGDIASVLATDAQPSELATIYGDLGVSVTYDPEGRKLRAELVPSAWATECVGGPSRAKPDWRIQPWDQGK